MNVENRVGIINFSTDTPGLQGLIKERASDFIVREILTDGTQLVTTRNRNLQVPPPSQDVKYTLFNLVKFNKDTILAIREIARIIGRDPEDFSYAGIKDNRAITVQRVACKGNIGNQLKQLQIKNIEINEILYGNRPIQIGELWGNNFSLVIRKISRTLAETREIVNQCIQQLYVRGFPNYYGIQRFGMHRPNSHEIGRLILLGRFEDAVKLMLFEQFESESQVARDFRARLEETQDFSWALEHFPDSLAYEKILIHHLVHHPRDYEGAFKQLPVSLQSLILSSFQSYLFNCHLNFRFAREKYLNRLLEGDRVTILDEYYGLPTRTLLDCTKANIEVLQRAVDLHHAAPVLPLIGYNTHLELWLENDQMATFLSKLGITLEDFRVQQLPHLKNYRGSFRPILIKPKDFEVIRIEADEYHPNAQCVEIQFSLPRGTYATCLVRELNKIPEEPLLDEGSLNTVDLEE